MSEIYDALWNDVLGIIKKQIQADSFAVWFKDTRLINLNHISCEAMIQVANGFAAEWLMRKYSIVVNEAFYCIFQKSFTPIFISPKEHGREAFC